ncbi:PHD finger protein 20-like protein 1 [Megalops cyprinoides]|uniref:PHD finger protein 20-like protein 1 n=1 Tax=Megalops cyprinoides TaxID=118141 RepID=UPI0018649906|nr:PHD finger protein 20-like protein 1 [Megalops cyprinoides]
MSDLKPGEAVLARWTDCRYYPAKIESVHKEGTYTVQFYDGVIRCMKRMHIKSMPEDAKGQQDWMALVRATSPMKRKLRTTSDRSMDKEERRAGRPEDMADREPADKDSSDDELDSTEKMAALGCIGMEEPKPSLEKAAMAEAKKERTKAGSMLSTKRSLSSKITVSKEAKEDETQRKEERSDAPETCAEGPCADTGEHSTPALPSKPRSVRPKQDPGDTSSSHCHPRDTAATEETQALGEATAPPGPGVPDTAWTDSILLAVEKSKPPLSKPTFTASPHPPLQPVITERGRQPESASSNQTLAGDKVFLPKTGQAVVKSADMKAAARTPKLNKHSREPIMNTIKSEDPTSPRESLFDPDHNKFKCQVPGCSKAFRKAKLLDYHLKYYHSTEKVAELEAGSPSRAGRTRTTSASVPCSTHPEATNSKRRRTVSTSASLSPPEHALHMDPYGVGLRPPKLSKKKHSSTSVSSEGAEDLLPPSWNKSFECLHDRILKKSMEKDNHLDLGQCLRFEKKVRLEEKCLPIGKKKEKDKDKKDKKEKDLFKIKQKKKKKKKKKSKHHNYSDFEDMPLALLGRCSFPVSQASGSGFNLHSRAPSRQTTLQYPRAILSVDLTGENLSDIDFLEDSSTESLFLSGDDCSQDLDSLSIDDFQEEGDTAEIVRCVCQTEEENGFMIQCEECMCWQHSMCMGLPEDSLPKHYTCYICRDPPGQRWSAKYQHDKDWLKRGHLYGLSFLSENYSHQNAQKIVSAHQLLADVYGIKEVLHGLQLKMGILQNKQSPSLHLWAQSWVNLEEDEPMGGRPAPIFYPEHLADSLGQSSNPDAYIASEHSYQKPPGLGLDPWPTAGLLSSQGEEGPTHTETAAMAVSGCLVEGRSELCDQARNHLQWQTNLLAHIEDVQNQVAVRMDLIERELDVLESWLDFSGELEPPDPLARLPQLKRRIKQLLTDLAKVQQMSTLCSI